MPGDTREITWKTIVIMVEYHFAEDITGTLYIEDGGSVLMDIDTTVISNYIKKVRCNNNDRCRVWIVEV